MISPSVSCDRDGHERANIGYGSFHRHSIGHVSHLAGNGKICGASSGGTQVNLFETFSHLEHSVDWENREENGSKDISIESHKFNHEIDMGICMSDIPM